MVGNYWLAGEPIGGPRTSGNENLLGKPRSEKRTLPLYGMDSNDSYSKGKGVDITEH